MSKAEKELKEHKARVEAIRKKMRPIVQELACNKATNPTDEANEKYNILEDCVYDLLLLT